MLNKVSMACAGLLNIGFSDIRQCYWMSSFAQVPANQAQAATENKGQTIPPDMAKRIISFASTMGHAVSYEDIYGAPEQMQAGAAEAGQGV